MNTATLVQTYKNSSGTVTVSSEVTTGDLEQNIEREQLPKTASGGTPVYQEFQVNIPLANIKALGLGCKRSAAVGGVANDGDVEVTVKLNSTSASAADTYVLTPANGYGWTPGMNALSPLRITSDITKLYVAATGTANADIMFRFLLDSTPGLTG